MQVLNLDYVKRRSAPSVRVRMACELTLFALVCGSLTRAHQGILQAGTTPRWVWCESKENWHDLLLTTFLHLALLPSPFWRCFMRRNGRDADAVHLNLIF